MPNIRFAISTKHLDSLKKKKMEFNKTYDLAYFILKNITKTITL